MTRLIVRRFLLSVLVTLVFVNSARAGVTYGPGGSGVTVGNSDLIDALDLSDSFTLTANGGIPGRAANAYPVNLPGINLEDNHGHPARVWTNAMWSISADANAIPGGTPYPGGSGSGSATGMTQRGGGSGDWGIEYGLRNDFVIQTDFVQTTDRVDVTFGAARDTIWNAGNFSVFFRHTGHPSYPEIGIFNPTVGERNTGLSSGIPSAGAWHNYAVRVDVPARELEVFVDEVSRGVIDLDTVAGGAFAGVPLSNTAVSAGYAGGDRGWSDNFQIGIPEPTVGPPSLVSYWNFDESATGTGTAWDQVHANNASFAGTATRAGGLIGAGAAQFNHTGGDAVNVGTGQNGVNNLFSFTEGVTVEALIQPDAALGSSRYEEIFRKEDGNNRILLSFQENGGILSFGINDGTGYKELDMPLDGNLGRPTLADLKDGDPHHIVATYDSASGLKGLYVDGALRFSQTVGAGVDMLSGGSGIAYIGNTAGLGEPFSGIIDEVAIYNMALSADEIQMHYDNVLLGQNYFATAVIPEPSTLVLAGMGLIALATLMRRRKRR